MTLIFPGLHINFADSCVIYFKVLQHEMVQFIDCVRERKLHEKMHPHLHGSLTCGVIAACLYKGGKKTMRLQKNKHANLMLEKLSYSFTCNHVRATLSMFPLPAFPVIFWLESGPQFQSTHQERGVTERHELQEVGTMDWGLGTMWILTAYNGTCYNYWQVSQVYKSFHYNSDFIKQNDNYHSQ